MSIFFINIHLVSASEYKFELLNENDGFSSSIIFSIAQDQSGFLWFGTGYNGLMRYDGKNIVQYQNDPSNLNSLPNDNAGNVMIDKNNNLWIGSWGGGVLRYNQEKQKFTQHQHVPDLSNTISSVRVQNIFEDQQGEIWLGTDNGLNKFNPNSQDFTQLRPNKWAVALNYSNRVWGIEQTNDDSLWIATEYGLSLLDKSTNDLTHYSPEPENVPSPINKIRQITIGANNTLFLGTQNGVLRFEPTIEKFTKLDVAQNISIGPIYSMIKTNFGQYWVSSDNGVFAFSDEDLQLKKVELDFDDRCSQSLFQDRQGIIWLSCEGTGVYKITRKNTFKTFNDHRIKAAYSLLATKDESLLVGTAQNGVYKWTPGTNKLTALGHRTKTTVQPEIRYMTQTSKGDIWYANLEALYKVNADGIQRQIEPTATTENRELFRRFVDLKTDEQDNIWVATTGGVFVIHDLDSDYEYIQIIDSQDPITSSAKQPSTLYLDPNNRMWIGTNEGLYFWDKQTKKVKLFDDFETLNLGSSRQKYIVSIFQDSQQRLWVSTITGLYLFNQEKAEFSVYNSQFSKIVNQEIFFISEDERGNLWFVTTKGLSKLNPINGDIRHFDKSDGLPDSRYYYQPTSPPSDGTIYFSSRDGIYYFDPNSVTDDALSEDTLLTNFGILGSNKTYNIAKAEVSGLRLNYDENNVKFEFATLDFLNARQIQYSYKLEGFDQDWIENDNNTSANYTNLGGGDYTFRVRAGIKNNQWYPNQLAVNLHISTPFWQQWWMFVFYGCLVILGIYYYLQRQKRAVIKFERQVAEKTASIALESSKLASANKIKTKFLANMSHEIRTPLTTVIGQAEAIICREVDPKDIYKEVEIIHDSSLYLLDLLNDILDLTKIEEHKFELEPVPQDLHGLLKNINTMFSLQAKVKGLSFTLVKDLPTPFIVNVDGLRLKQILINLCSNAVKFTLVGHVCLKVSTQENNLVFNIEDSGIGISESQRQQIFDSFTQGDSSIRRRFGGSGLGLHLSTQLANLMGGTITVKSELGLGSVFTFSIPIKVISADTELLQKKSSIRVSYAENLFSGKILLAEDHPNNRRLIARLLKNLGFTVFAASDGLEALDLYSQHAPDVVLLDIQMPNMDGIQAYNTLRDLGCSQPIIALTANAMENEVEYYSALGFDGYIRKPIERQLLIAALAQHFSSKDEEVEQKAVNALGKVDMSDLVVEFKNSLLTEKEQFILHGANNDLEQIEKQAHRLCGAAQLFGFTQLSNIATQLESKIKNKIYDPKEIPSLLQNLLDEIDKIIAE
ncbi:two-component regulator propeller domain-containing protein [Paraglaciecola sp. 25GB23A]|uniref:hybrid sensor histidine kinase/response regulator n=1 Tax=Paraglaciecola sp. 25GB23A TaxID=3156068 RepID=UPI0032AF1EBA